MSPVAGEIITESSCCYYRLHNFVRNGIIMSQSFVQFYSHIVFHTKNNEKLIRDEIHDELYSYIGGILKNYRSIPFQIGGTSDHVHVSVYTAKNHVFG